MLEKEVEGAAVEADYQKSQPTARQSEAERMAHVTRETEEVGEFVDNLAECIRCCAVCNTEGSEEVDHKIEDCSRRDTSMWERTDYGAEMMESRRFAKFSVCFGCRLPQAICEQSQAASTDGRLFKRVLGRRCQYGRVISRIAAGRMARDDKWWAEQIRGIVGAEVQVSDEAQMERAYSV